MGHSDEKHDEAKQVILRAVALAQKYVPQIMDDTENGREAIVTTSVILSIFARISGVSMHSLMGIVMETYKRSSVLEDNENF